MLYIAQGASQRPARKGVVLLVVVGLLALFAVVGLTFVYYAEAEAATSRIAAQSQTANFIDVEPDLLLSYALSQLICGVDDLSANGANNSVFSAMRAHDFGRNMYGYNRNTLNVTPFNGLGRANSGNDPSLLLPVQNLPNYQYFPKDGFVRDPGRYVMNRTNPALPYTSPSSAYIGENVPWTYADLENFYLGQMKADGTILAQSFWRPWASNTGVAPFNFNLSMDSGDPNYSTIWGNTYTPAIHDKLKYMTLRPLPCLNAGFPPPEDGGGDVRCCEFGPGVPIPGLAGKFYNNDSILIDPASPARVGPNGKMYRPLFAFFITDLDGKVNLNASGNARLYDGTNYGHGSNKGLTPTEINLAKIFPS